MTSAAAPTPDRHDHWWYHTSLLLTAFAIVSGACMAIAPGKAAEALYGYSVWVLPPFVCLAAARVLWRLRGTPQCRAWTLIPLGLAGFLTCEVVRFVAWLDGRSIAGPLAGLSDLSFAPLVLAGVLRMVPLNDTPSVRRRRYFDAAILTGASAALAHTVTTFSGGNLFRGVETASGILPLVRPASDLVTLAMLAMLWVRRDGGALPVWAASIGVAMFCGLLGDLWFAWPASDTYASPWFVQLAWYALWSALGVGITRALTPETLQPRHGAISTLPYLLVAACFVTLALAVGLDERAAETSATVGVGLTTTLVLIRQFLTLHDMTAMQDERTRSAADARLAALVRHGNDMLVIVTEQFEVLYASPSHEWVVGVPPDRMLGQSVVRHIHRDDQPRAMRSLERLLTGASPRESMVVRWRDAYGQWRWIESVGSNLLQEPTIGGLVFNSRDITDRKTLEDQLLEQALRDPLTGLGNRRLFNDRVAHAIERQQRSATTVAVMLLDLDHFKFVNDTLGHAKGDALLMAVADRVRLAVRSGDTVARLGGDEFAILLEDVSDTTEVERTAQRVLDAIGRPFPLDGRDVFVQSSIGIAWASAGQSVDDLVTDADVAMYAAKNAGRNRFERFSTAMRDSVTERHDVEVALRSALERDELDLVYQPVVDLETGHISGAEALIRWRHPEHGELPPSRFIPIAEESELIVHIGRRMLRRAAGDARRFREATPNASTIRIAVNLSGRQLLSDTLVSDVEEALSAAGVPGAAMAVELTETVLASHEPAIVARLQRLRALGVRIALDDFGTGYSSLSYLRHYPIDVLKVDRCFVSWNDAEHANEGVARAVVSMGHSLNMRTVAEGIETLEQLEHMRSLGCSLGQGYLFSQPVDRDAFEALLMAWEHDLFRRTTPPPAVGQTGA
jgi:diguanylate cyclase (GGDEF)-like protein/PAS domain S-box-containing protein